MLFFTKISLYHFVTFLDILFVSLLCYWVYIRLKGTFGIRILLGSLMLYACFVVLKICGFQFMTALLGQLMEFSALAFVILFQQEIRKLLFRLGHTSLIKKFLLRWRFFSKKKADQSDLAVIQTLIHTIQTMQKERVGAILVLSKYNTLKMYEETGQLLNAKLSARLLLSIFAKSSPLHDGGVIIYADTIKAAGCVLPITDRVINAKLGLRHRAAMGMAEIADVLVIVVSEETGNVAIAQEEKIIQNVNIQQVQSMIHTYFSI